MPLGGKMPDLRPVLYIVGSLLIGLGALMLIPAAVDIMTGFFGWPIFIISGVATSSAGGLLLFAFQPKGRTSLGTREGFLVTALSWIILCGFGSLPFILGDRLSFTNAFFEAMSGLTTTGSTVITNLNEQAPGILLWRAILQWIGGIGIIIVAVAVLPFLRVGGMHLFRTESSDRSDKIRPRVTQIAGILLLVYVVLTFICIILLRLAGMPSFDAICHAMAILATGGFSTKDASIGFYQSPAIEWIASLFMLLGGTTFALMARLLLMRDPKPLLRDSQMRWYLLVFATFTLAMVLWQFAINQRGFADSLRASVFAVSSILTTTGLVAEDYTLWGSLPVAAMMILLFIGGCTGSTSGGIKIFRICILSSFATWQIRSLVHPHRILLPTYNHQKVSDDVVRSVISFVSFYILSFAVLGIGAAAFGLDLVTAFSGVAQALGNVGPGLGTIIGPAGNFASLPDGAKWIMSFAMLLGRLELMTLLVLFSPGFWRG